MDQDKRPNPEDLLNQLKHEEAKNHRGQLRVFLGMSAGVGKTYAMLTAAHQKVREARNVVIGIVETHGRSDTARLLEGLKVLPRKKLIHRNSSFEELDIDAILALKPELVIVDELAHTNIPGSRHKKRHQDVQEILDAGIDVYTALNVQHLESRKDAVESITGITIQETVPDSILEQATQIELVDIAPNELLKRLKEGKVYLGDKAGRAAENFFKENKLTALREIALRITAERVDQDLQRFNTGKSTPWQTNERLLVAISHSPSSEKLIRATRRLAYNLEAPWIAVHVDTGIHLNDEDQLQLQKNIQLAQELKAEVINITETDLPRALEKLAREKNVTQIIVGRPTRRWFRHVLEGGSLLNKLVRDHHEVDVHVLRQDKVVVPPSLMTEILMLRSQTGFAKYWYTLCFLVALSIAGVVLVPAVGYRSVGFLFLLGVMIVGFFGGMGSVMLAASLSALIWNFGFIPPIFTFAIFQPEDVILCFSYFVVALVTGFLTQRIRFHERLMREREERTNVLYQTLKDISESPSSKEYIPKVTERVGELLQAHCAVVLRTLDGDLERHTPQGRLEEKEFAVAQWAYQNQKMAGWSTDTLSQSNSLYIPLTGTSEKIGVFIYKPERRIRRLSPDQGHLLYSITGQLALALEREVFKERAQETLRLKDSERLHQTLLNSISHEIRTPLTVIRGLGTGLRAQSPSNADLEKLSQDLDEASDRLNRVIENLLDMSRLNSGAFALKLEWQDLSDILSVTLRKLQKPLDGHPVHLDINAQQGLLHADFRLLEHALSNIILNSTQYAGEGSQIWIRAENQAGFVQVVIEDDGKGIPAELRNHVFEKFYRVPGTAPGGTGLGLSIVKGIIELHGGSIVCTERPPQGTRFVITLPLKPQPSLPQEAP
ncbi:hypothetical protein AZI86_14565 [Bdellovibrio bacteriovorus]|uniref:histidine kinase n=1 Tax=Bdellovibrio bacteriovorus TaxID=959 RepID=A0A150WJR2_BDEBC|nr:sensor histidine kinase KdpD [Bdellovibrio bacteriovorus]KYG64027.1 hypothetical protein AZI86_14565 [Bdellovibrio bacteriovorus]